MFLIDTNVISEARKRERANQGVQEFFERVKVDRSETFMSVVTVGELRRGVEHARHRGDAPQGDGLEAWLNWLLDEYRGRLLGVDLEIAERWGRLMVPHPESPFDKLIAATAMVHGLTVATRNYKDFADTGVRQMNPFE